MIFCTRLFYLQDSPDIGNQGRWVILRHRVELLAPGLSKPHHRSLHGRRQLQEGCSQLRHHPRISPHLDKVFGIFIFEETTQHNIPVPASKESSNEPVASRSWSPTRFEAEEGSWWFEYIGEGRWHMITTNLNQDVILCLCQLHHSQKSWSSLGQILGDLEQNIVLAPAGALLYRSCEALCT